MILKKYSLAAILLLIVASASAQRADLDSNRVEALRYEERIKQYKIARDRDQLRALAREYNDFKKRTRYRYPQRVGITGGFMAQQIGLKNHPVLTPPMRFFAKGVNFGFQFHITKAITIESGLAIMGNYSNVLSSVANLAQFRAGDSMNAVPAKGLNTNDKIIFYSPYIQSYYKIPLSQDLTFEPFVRLALNHLSVRPESTYFLVGKANTYNEILTANNYLTYALAVSPGACLSTRLSKSIKFCASTAYSMNTLGHSLSNKNTELLTITSSNNGENITQQFDRPQLKNGIMASLGLQIIFHPNIYAHEKGYTSPANYNREVY